MPQHPTRQRAIKWGAVFSFLQIPRSIDPDKYSRQLVLQVLFLGTLGLIAAAFTVVCINYLSGLTYVAPRIAMIGLIAVGMAWLYALRKRHYILASCGLLALYFGASSIALWLWGVETPIGTLMLALAIVLSGILLGSRFALYALGLSAVILAAAQSLILTGTAKPDVRWAITPAGYYDVVIFTFILGNLALVSWLYTRSIEQSLQRARRSEQALIRQKESLEATVKERTREIQAVHFERVQEMYRFSELGHMSVALLHDVANYLSVLSLDIEDLKQARQNRAAVMRRVQQSIRYLNGLIGQVRSQIKDESNTSRLNIADEIDQVTHLLEYRAAAQGVTIVRRHDSPRAKLWHTGNRNHLWQVLTNLISNAIDAYADQDAPHPRQVVVTAEHGVNNLSITITDHGVGIPAAKLRKIFEPFYTSKENGMGIGLAVTKRLVEKNFKGSIHFTSTQPGGTTCMVSIPLGNVQTHEQRN